MLVIYNWDWNEIELCKTWPTQIYIEQYIEHTGYNGYKIYKEMFIHGHLQNI